MNILKYLSSKKAVYKFAVKIIANRIVHQQNLLTPKYLRDKGWTFENGFWFEPNIKGRDKIWISIRGHYYRVYHGEDRTFISLESKLEWFEVYYLLAHSDNGRYELAKV